MDTVTPPTPPLVLRDQLIRDASGLPALLESAAKSDPALVESLTEKSLLGSKTAWFPPIAWGVTSTVSHYGLGWDSDTSTEIASLIAYLVMLGVRYVTRSPIGSILPK